MTRALDQTNSLAWQKRQQRWLDHVNALSAQVAEWSSAEKWEVERDRKSIREKAVGEYEVPVLRIRHPEGELLLEPIGLVAAGAEGRVDLEAFPTLSRVKFLGGEHGWTIMTDSNVPLRVPWTREAFVQLAGDLLS